MIGCFNCIAHVDHKHQLLCKQRPIPTVLHLLIKAITHKWLHHYQYQRNLMTPERLHLMNKLLNMTVYTPFTCRNNRKKYLSQQNGRVRIIKCKIFLYQELLDLPKKAAEVFGRYPSCTHHVNSSLHYRFYLVVYNRDLTMY